MKADPDVNHLWVTGHKGRNHLKGSTDGVLREELAFKAVKVIY